MKSRTSTWLTTLCAGSFLFAAQLIAAQTGSVVSWGFQWIPHVTPGTSLIAITAGMDHSLALRSDGTVVGWGYNSSGQSEALGGSSGLIAVAAGAYHSLALKSDGTVAAWGDNTYGQSIVPGGLSGIIAIAAGERHNLALKSNGTVVAWGWSYVAQSTVPRGLSGVIAIASGQGHSLALVADEPEPPSLQAQLSGGSVVITWPLSAEGYGLERTPNLSPPTWETVTNAPVISADTYVLTNSWSDPSRFFRLRAR